MLSIIPNNDLSHSTIGSYIVSESSLTLSPGEQRIISFSKTLDSFHMLGAVFDISNATNIIATTVHCPIGATGTVAIIMSYVCIGASKTFTPTITVVGILKHPKMTIN